MRKRSHPDLLGLNLIEHRAGDNMVRIWCDRAYKKYCRVGKITRAYMVGWVIFAHPTNVWGCWLNFCKWDYYIIQKQKNRYLTIDLLTKKRVYETIFFSQAEIELSLLPRMSGKPGFGKVATVIYLYIYNYIYKFRIFPTL